MLVGSRQILTLNTNEFTQIFTEQADWMLVNVTKLSQFYKDTLDRKGMYWTAKAIFDARMVAEFGQIGHSAKKTPDDVDHWDKLVSKHEGLRCRRGYDKPLNEEGLLKKMIRFYALR